MSLLAVMSMREQLMLTYVSYIYTKTCNVGIYTALSLITQSLVSPGSCGLHQAPNPGSYKMVYGYRLPLQ